MYNPLCQFKDILGKPNEGLRNKFRYMGLPMIDVIVTLLFIFLFSIFTKTPILHVFIYTTLAMIISHRLFCVRSATDILLFS